MLSFVLRIFLPSLGLFSIGNGEFSTSKKMNRTPFQLLGPVGSFAILNSKVINHFGGSLYRQRKVLTFQ